MQFKEALMKRTVHILGIIVAFIVALIFSFFAESIWQSTNKWNLLYRVMWGLCGITIYSLIYIIFSGKIPSLVKTIYEILGTKGRTIFALCIIFYAGLIGTLYLWKNYIDSAWLILFVAAFPLIIYLVILLLEKIKDAPIEEIQAGSFKIKLAQVQPSSDQVTDKLDAEQLQRLEKGSVEDAVRMVEEAINQSKRIEILQVNVGSKSSTNVGAVSMYVRMLSDKFPEDFQYIVFVDEFGKYRNFFTKDEYLELFSYAEFDVILGYSKKDFYNLNVIINSYNNVQAKELKNAVETFRKLSEDPQWRSLRIKIHRNEIRLANELYETGLNIIRGEVNRTSPLTNPTVEDAYNELNDLGRSALPIVNSQEEFIGVADYKTIAKTIFKQTR